MEARPVIALLDTDVLIVCLRGEPAAQTWLTSVETDDFKLPGVVAMELAIGCQTKDQLQRVEIFLSTFEVIWPTADDFSLAYQLLIQHRFTSGLGISDCLIAAQAVHLSATLYSFNVRHFRHIQGLQVQQPFIRNQSSQS